MSKEKPSIPKGTRDFGPKVLLRRDYILREIRRVFEKFGYQPLETPAMENLSVLTGKYGEEGGQLMFKVLNNGLHEKKEPEKEKLKEQWDKMLQQPFSTPAITERALRYDLTVPFARYVVMNRNEIALPFKRYQIQPVWRADRPQRGRYREFYQCDADVVGTKSLLCEAEIVLMMDEVLTFFGLKDFTIKINHRGILAGIAEAIGQKGREADICVAIDKIDKIGIAGVRQEMLERGIVADSIAALEPILNLNGDNDSVLEALASILEDSEEGNRGLTEIKTVFEYLRSFTLHQANIKLDITLARGLSYYTGCIFEVKVNNVNIGSISGGGRYDNLTGMFGLPDVSGVGFSFGVDRIYDVLEELNLLPVTFNSTTKLLISNFDKASEQYSLPLLQQFRQAGIATELYPEAAKLKKQMTYADQKKIPYVLLVGSEEMQSGLLQLKDMRTGDQRALKVEEIVSILQNQ